MHTLLTCAVCLLASASGAASEDGDALVLLQMSSARVSVHSDKECKAARKDQKAAKKTAKTDKAAAKAAKAAWKAARKAMKESKEAQAAADAKVLDLCPLPEVDRSPDEGCSATLITSCTPGVAQPEGALLLERGLPYNKWYGFEEVLPGGGVPSVPTPTADGGSSVFPLTTSAMRKLGIAVMQPCSVAWTVGFIRYPYQVQGSTGKLPPTFRDFGDPNEQVFLRKENLKSPCECRAWAETVMPWPTGAAVEFLGHKSGGYGGGTPTQCTVFSMSSIPWKNLGFSLTLAHSANTHFSCYLGNPEEWKERLDKEKEAGRTVDKCSKTSLWSSGKWELQANRTTRSTVPHQFVGSLSWPDPDVNSEAGRKMCLKWVKTNPKCANAIAIELHEQGCWCVFTTDAINKGGRQEAPWITKQVCML